MAMPKYAKSAGLTNGGWFAKKYRTPEELDRAKREQAKRSYEKHRAATTQANWVRQIKELGCTVDLYEQLWAIQGGCCAICRKPNSVISKKPSKQRTMRWAERRRLAVDHCHVSGKIRGLLCSKCNTALGAVNDDVELLKIMEDYLCRLQK